MVIYHGYVEAKNEAFDYSHVTLEAMERRAAEFLIKGIPIEALRELFEFGVSTTKETVLVHANFKL